MDQDMNENTNKTDVFHQIGNDVDNRAQDTVRPGHIPEKFWDSKNQTVRIDALIKSYLELEKRFSKLVHETAMSEKEGNLDTEHEMSVKPEEQKKGTYPKSPDEYAITCAHTYFKPDPELNAHFHELGMTNEQVQAVYDAALQKMIPFMMDMVSDMRAEQELNNVIAYFGGAEQWGEIAPRLYAFLQKNMPSDIAEKMAQSADGIKMVHRMMMASTGGVVPFGAGGKSPQTIEQIYALMRDPKYWRDHDPAIMEKVSSGFGDYYGG